MLNLYRVEDSFDRSYLVRACSMECAVQEIFNSQVENGVFSINTCYHVLLIEENIGGYDE